MTSRTAYKDCNSEQLPYNTTSITSNLSSYTPPWLLTKHSSDQPRVTRQTARTLQLGYLVQSANALEETDPDAEEPDIYDTNYDSPAHQRPLHFELIPICTDLIECERPG